MSIDLVQRTNYC